MATTQTGDRAEKQVVVAEDHTIGKQAPVVFIEGNWVNERKQKLYTVEYLPVEGDPQAILLFHHGLGEHVGRYHDVFSRFPVSRIAVYSYDAHGMGKSEPFQPSLRSLVSDFNHMIIDYEARLDAVKEAFTSKGKPVPPIFAAGHSLGGLIAAHAVARNPQQFAGLALHSAAIDVEWTPILRLQAMIGNILAALFPRAQLVPAVRPEDMSSDPEVVRRYLEDPLINHGKVKARTANESLKAFSAMQRMGSKLDVPLYVCHGTDDRCTSIRAAKRLYETCPNKDKVFKEVPGGYHELLHGPEREECYEALSKWINAHLTPRSSL